MAIKYNQREHLFFITINKIPLRIGTAAMKCGCLPKASAMPEKDLKPWGSFTGGLITGMAGGSSWFIGWAHSIEHFFGPVVPLAFLTTSRYTKGAYKAQNSF